MLMAGRAAQQIVVGKVSAGSGGSDDSDLARATKMALAMERSLGFGATQPLLYRDDKDPTAVLDSNPDLAARIHARLEKALARAVEIISENRDKFDTLTKALFDAQALDGEAVAKILKRGDRASCGYLVTLRAVHVAPLSKRKGKVRPGLSLRQGAQTELDQAGKLGEPMCSP